MRITFLLSLLTLGVVPVVSKLRPNNGAGTNKAQRQLQNRATFQSFFDIDYLTDGTEITDFDLVAQALATAYNDLIKQGYSDPYNRTMDTVEVVDTTTQQTDLNAFLRVTGSCNGCPSNSKFTVDVRRRNLKDSKKKNSKASSGGKGGHEKDKKSSKSPKSTGKGHSHDIPIAPTTEELRFAYSDAIKRLQTGVLDVVRMDEVDSMPSEPANPPSSYDEGTDQGGNSGKGSVDCPAIGGSFTGTFTSYFMATYELVKDTNDDVPAAVAALSTAYNTVIQRYEADITMEEASIYDPATGRRLSFEEVDLRRKLQYRRPYYISVTGRCTGCTRSFTFGNQVNDRRKLSSWGQCLLPGLPTANEINTEYNVELDRLNLPNVISCLQLDEIEQPTIPGGKGSTGKSTKAPPKSSKGDKEPKSAKSAKAKSGKRTRR